MYYYDIYEKKKYYCPYVNPIDAFTATCMDEIVVLEAGDYEF